jgi:hypothetical protein
MGTSSWLATWMDATMLLERGVPIASAPPLGAVVPRPGPIIGDELAGRLLTRYITPGQVGRFDHGSTFPCYTTPTPFSPEEALAYLLVPQADTPRDYAYLLDPRRIRVIQGTLWVAAARGIQYILPEGFPGDAIVVPGAPTGRWAIPVR